MLPSLVCPSVVSFLYTIRSSDLGMLFLSRPLMFKPALSPGLALSTRWWLFGAMARGRGGRFRSRAALANSDPEAVPLMLLVVDTPGFTEEGVEIIVSSSGGFVAWSPPVRFDTVLEA